ncbi:MAG: putative molybdenum carrier protein [Kiritimatiellia bacterium]|jgi:hypothetical protein|nr:putative molybdenum carrier protein [Kiritimatiellia bacterium]
MRFVSGGQTGVDRGVLDACIACEYPHGGYCPKGRLAEDGRIPDRYNLEETESEQYAVRTRLNVAGSDATVVAFDTELTGGTLFSLEIANELGRQSIVLNMRETGSSSAAAMIHSFIVENGITTLNWSGPRASGSDIAYDWARKTAALVIGLLGEAAHGDGPPTN